MTIPVGRVGDIGIGLCAAHTSPRPCVVTLVTGAPLSNVNGLNTATAITVGVSSCGHASVVLTFSALAKAEKAGIHRVGDVGALPGGIYTLVTGSPNSKAGG